MVHAKEFNSTDWILGCWEKNLRTINFASFLVWLGCITESLLIEPYSVKPFRLQEWIRGVRNSVNAWQTISQARLKQAT
jgi:hypothetical protein